MSIVSLRLSIEISIDERADCCSLFQVLFLHRMIDVHLFRPNFCTHISQYPMVSPLQRFLATQQKVICSQTHKTLFLRSTGAVVAVSQMNGNNSIAQLTELMQAEMAKTESTSQAKAQQKMAELLNDLLVNGALIG